MATVTGKLSDVGLDSLDSRSPEIVWVPSAPTTTLEGNLISAVPITTIPAPDGTFSVDLIPTEETSPPITYALRIRLLDPAAGYIWADFPDWNINVPWEGGALAEIATRPIAAGAVWEVPGDMIPADARPGDLMLNTLTSDLYRIG